MAAMKPAVPPTPTFTFSVKSPFRHLNPVDQLSSRRRRRKLSAVSNQARHDVDQTSKQTNRMRNSAVPPIATFAQRGFTLIELAIVLFIVALMIGGMLLPLSAQQDIRSNGDTQKVLADARDALLGFAMVNDRFPCPASAASNGLESPVGGGACTNPYDGFLPAATLGLAPVDAQGFLLDGWGGEQIRRVRYAVSKANSNALTTTSGMKNTGITTLAPDLQICSTGVGIVAATPDTATCAANASLATDAVAVIYSLGKNAGTGGTSNDEKHNPNPLTAVAPDRAFVSTPPGITFDDQVVWLSKNILFNRMVAAGKLP
jgi:prepilin-type N-terminal cleavage/methylation domain-containing protein